MSASGDGALGIPEDFPPPGAKEQAYGFLRVTRAIGVRRLVGREVHTPVFDECTAISGIDKGAPLDHLVQFFGPYFSAQALLADDARVVALSAGGANIGLDRPGGQVEGGPNEPYDQFYVAMQRWGRYELVGAPADADLVLQLRFSAPLSSCETYQPQLTLAILDTKTHFRLWTFTEAVKDALLARAI